jgi:flagellar basal body-associated protein FliL|tara:strand:- start:119 stop:259 length:141 start_codon:yes stop_codon:yes gene_type:complete
MSDEKPEKSTSVMVILIYVFIALAVGVGIMSALNSETDNSSEYETY